MRIWQPEALVKLARDDVDRLGICVREGCRWALTSMGSAARHSATMVAATHASARAAVRAT